jgi:calcyclin binding protein
MESAPIPKMSADDLRLDLEELRRLEGLATRPRVLSLLANEIRSVDAKVPFFLSLFLTPRPRASGRSIRFPSARWADYSLCSVVMFL